MQREKPDSGLSPLSGDMSGDDFRRFGHEIVDWISEYFEHPERYQVLPNIQPGSFAAEIPLTFPEK